VLRLLFISLLIVIPILDTTGQVVVVDAADLTGVPPSGFLPDVEGKVVVDQSYYNYLNNKAVADNPEVFPGWPATEEGANECGGVYCNLDDDPGYEVVYPVGAALFAFNIDASYVEGWPKTLDYPTDGAASFGDIDGDGAGEIVCTTHQTGTFAFGKIYAYNTDGSVVSGFPVTTEGGPMRTPTLADLDGDGDDEIIITIRNWPDGLVSVYDGAGNLVPGWPVRMDYVPASSAAVGDINGDEIPEIVVESYYSLHAFTPDGLLVSGFPYYPGEDRVFSYSTPVLADIDGDGNREIICGDHSLSNGSGGIHVVKYNGTGWFDWPLLTTSWVYSPPSVGDINDDGQLDIIVGDQTLAPAPVNQVYAWNAYTGEMLPGFPITQVNGINSQILLADLDGDGFMELLADDNMEVNTKGQYQGFNHDGTKMDDWLLETLGSSFFINPMVMDINDDGILDISGGGTGQDNDLTSLYIWNSGVEWNSALNELPILQYNTRHTGVYGDTFMVGIADDGGMEAWGQGGMEAGKQGGWEVYPNPASDHVNLYNTGPDNDLHLKDLQFTIYNSSGELVIPKLSVISNQVNSFDITHLPAGINWIEISDKSGLRACLKFIKINH
jgi:hypothetical protein